MARNDPKSPPTTGKIKFRVIEFEMEGGNERIEQGLRTLAQAVARGPEPAARTIAGQRSRPPAGLNAGSDVNVDTDDPNEGSDEERAEELDPGETDSVVGDVPSKSRPRLAPRAPKFLSTLNLVYCLLNN